MHTTHLIYSLSPFYDPKHNCFHVIIPIRFLYTYFMSCNFARLPMPWTMGAILCAVCCSVPLRNGHHVHNTILAIHTLTVSSYCVFHNPPSSNSEKWFRHREWESRSLSDHWLCMHDGTMVRWYDGNTWPATNRRLYFHILPFFFLVVRFYKYPKPLTQS